MIATNPPSEKPLRLLAEQALSRAAGAPLLGGNALELLIDAAAHFDAWLKAIRGAQQRVLLEVSWEAIERAGIDAELIDLRFLDRASLDWETVGASVRKTGAVLIVEQGALGTSYGGWLADEVQRRFFDWLDQPVQRVHGTESSPSISKVLERAAIAKTEEVAAGLERVRDGFGKVQG